MSNVKKVSNQIMVVSEQSCGRPCTYCLHALKWLPVLFSLSLSSWSYYAYVWQFCRLIIQNEFNKYIYLTVFHVLLIMMETCYLRTIFTRPKMVPEEFLIPENTLEAYRNNPDNREVQAALTSLGSRLPIKTVTFLGGLRICDHCKLIKPDRAHHCKVCNRCVLRMDHHCPWINNCISFTNYKYFVLYLTYAFTYCLFIMSTTFPYFMVAWGEKFQDQTCRYHVLFLFLLSSIFGFGYFTLLLYHCCLVLHNRTTFESFHPPVFRDGGIDKHGFYLGACANFKQVFGVSCWRWLLPIPTSLGDGLDYPVRSQDASKESGSR
ncbi:unnamed protein product [Phyllotreta striolata]|uniref:Palmitoyltransferase n=1 Tax=Phyllotreta striolata TaxID=444603 RepID=A0A9N9XNB4_PHYSR|nr:unnamed protein product [Phyllotreta striolata]